MPVFTVTYYDKDRQIKTLEFEQPSENAVLLFLRRQGIVPISVIQKKTKKPNKILGRGKISLLEKEIMCRHLATLIKIGTPMFEAVELLLEGTKNSKMIQVYRDILAGLEEGKLFSSIFEKYPKYFPVSFTSIVRVGEATGTLDQSFALLADQIGKQRELKKRVTSATVYPVILIFAVIALIFLVLVFVIPRIGKIFGSLGTKLPPVTQFLINISDVITGNPTITFGILGVLVVTLIVAFKPLKKLAGIAATKMPGIKNLVLEIRLAHISRNLATMIKSGLPLTQSLEIEALGLTGTPYEQALKDVTADVTSGISLAESMKRRPKLFPGMFVGMMRVGEKTATLDEILTNMAGFYEEEVDSLLKNLSAYIEPILLLFIGAIVLLIAVSVLIPIYSLVSNIGT